MSNLEKLYVEIENKALTWISIDNHEDCNQASAFVSREHTPRPNYHDADASLGNAYQSEGILHAALIDLEGKVAFYEPGYEISDLRSTIRKLGPQFQPLGGRDDVATLNLALRELVMRLLLF